MSVFDEIESRQAAESMESMSVGMQAALASMTLADMRDLNNAAASSDVSLPGLEICNNSSIAPQAEQDISNEVGLSHAAGDINRDNNQADLQTSPEVTNDQMAPPSDNQRQDIDNQSDQRDPAAANDSNSGNSIDNQRDQDEGRQGDSVPSNQRDQDPGTDSGAENQRDQSPEHSNENQRTDENFEREDANETGPEDPDNSYDADGANDADEADDADGANEAGEGQNPADQAGENGDTDNERRHSELTERAQQLADRVAGAMLSGDMHSVQAQLQQLAGQPDLLAETQSALRERLQRGLPGTQSNVTLSETTDRQGNSSVNLDYSWSENSTGTPLGGDVRVSSNGTITGSADNDKTNPVTRRPLSEKEATAIMSYAFGPALPPDFLAR